MSAVETAARGEISLDELAAELRGGARAILMVRHGERPKMDPDDPSFGDALKLTYEGVRTARLLGERLREFREGAHFYASPLTRTRMTAACIAEGMGLPAAEVPVDGLLGNESFYYADAAEVLDVFRPNNFFPACFEYFRTGELRGFRNLYQATDEMEAWLLAHFTGRLFVVATHDLYVAAFLRARNAVPEFTRENWPRFLDGGVILLRPDGTRRYALVRTGFSSGIVGVHRPHISGVVFDFGGVMTTTTMPERARRCAEEEGLPWPAMQAGYARYRHLLDGGFLSPEAMYDLIWADAGVTVPPEVAARVREADFASYLVGCRNERTLRWMRELKAAGYRIGILTNMPPSFAPRFREVYADFVALADAMVISGEELMFKPQRRIYDLLQARLGLPAEELCFIDDVEENCAAARSAGWHAVRFEGNARAEGDFALFAG